VVWVFVVNATGVRGLDVDVDVDIEVGGDVKKQKLNS
jgi:hypothetical protein